VQSQVKNQFQNSYSKNLYTEINSDKNQTFQFPALAIQEQKKGPRPKSVNQPASQKKTALPPKNKKNLGFELKKVPDQEEIDVMKKYDLLE